MQIDSTNAPLVAAIITGVFSFVGALIATKFSKDGERKHDARQLAKTFKGELAALVDILKIRDYQSGIRATADRCLAENQVFFFSISARNEYFSIYRSNAAKIGSLREPLPERIAIFYTQASSLLEDFASLTEISNGTKPAAILGTPGQAAARYELLAQHIDNLIEHAKTTIAQIDRHYPN
jgi:hypothetical protein